MTLLYPEEAIERVRGAVGHTIVERLLGETMEVDVRDLTGRLIAEPLKAPISLPPTLKSTLDGYAVRVEPHPSGPPLRFMVKGYSRIGRDVEASIGFGECFYVDTGARVPVGANAVIPVEDCERRGDYVIARKAPRIGEGLAMPASDIAEGDLVVYRGSRAYPEVAAALASLGYRRVKASRRVRVAVLAVGSELVEPGEPLKPGDVYESSRSYVISRFKLEGYDVVDMGIVRDDFDSVAEALHKAAEAADIVVACGGTSMGAEDYTYKVIESRGSIVVRGLKVKPGKPTKVGVLGGSLVIALSGNPRAAVNVTESFIIPLLDTLGLPLTSRRYDVVDARLAASVKLDPKRRLKMPAALVRGKGGFLAFPVAVESYMIASLPKADSETELEGLEEAPKGYNVRLRVYRSPEPTIVSLIDTKLIDFGKTGLRVVNLTSDDTSEILGELENSGVLAVFSSLQVGDPVGEVLEEVTRRVVIASKGGGCRRVAVYKPYSGLEAFGEGVETVAVNRAETARILLKQSYVDCAVIPEEYAVDYPRLEFKVVERVFLSRL